MLKKLTSAGIEAIKKAAKLLTGRKRRQYLAEISRDYFEGNTRKAERVFGWGRRTVAKGLRELETGIHCIDHFSGRGNLRTEDKKPRLREDIQALIEPQSQTDPDFKAPLRYTRMTASAVRKALMEEKGWAEEEVPSVSTLRDLLNRLGYRLRRVQKSKPLKKIPETNEIFENTLQANQEADEDSKTVRISVDVKDKVKLGKLSRGGKSRGAEATEAQDHDTEILAKLVPVGIFEPVSGRSSIYFGTSQETTDLVVDGLELWWESNKERFMGIQRWVINLDHGPPVQSHRTWFIKRLTEFSDQTALEIHRIYYPPYHSKYNPVERLWGILENHWNGTLLESMETALAWAATMTWNSIRPVVDLVTRVYEHGKRLTKKQMEVYEQRIKRSSSLPKWDVMICPQIG